MIIILLLSILILLFFIFINTNRIKYEIIENKIINSQQKQIENNNLINTWTPLTCDPYYQPCSGNYFYNDGYYYPL